MDEKEFRDKVMALQHRMYHLGLRLSLSPDEAADAVQDTLISLWKFRERIPPDSPPLEVYCLLAMKNQSISALRSRRITDGIEEAESIKGLDAIRQLEAADLLRKIDEMLRHLPTDQAEALRLNTFEELDHEEISAKMGKSRENIRQLLSRARRRIKGWKLN